MYISNLIRVSLPPQDGLSFSHLPKHLMRPEGRTLQPENLSSCDSFFFAGVVYGATRSSQNKLLIMQATNRSQTKARCKSFGNYNFGVASQGAMAEYIRSCATISILLSGREFVRYGSRQRKGPGWTIYRQQQG